MVCVDNFFGTPCDGSVGWREGKGRRNLIRGERDIRVAARWWENIGLPAAAALSFRPQDDHQSWQLKGFIGSASLPVKVQLLPWLSALRAVDEGGRNKRREWRSPNLAICPFLWWSCLVVGVFGNMIWAVSSSNTTATLPLLDAEMRRYVMPCYYSWFHLLPKSGYLKERTKYNFLKRVQSTESYKKNFLRS